MILSKNQIKLFASLQQKKYRDIHGLYLVEGVKMVEEALTHCPEMIHAICVLSSEAPQFMNSEAGRFRELYVTDAPGLAKISNQKTPQSLIAVMCKPESGEQLSASEDDVLIYLDGIRDPGNLGTIIRTAEWFGFKNLVCSPGSVDCFNPKTVQATMGSVFRLKIYYQKLETLIGPTMNIPVIYGTTLSGDNIFQTTLVKPSILVFGNESEGISKECLKLVQKQIKIPAYGNLARSAESLNVSIAFAVAVSEFRRQLG